MISLTVVQNTPYRVNVKRSSEIFSPSGEQPAQWTAVRLKEKIQDLAELRDWSVRKVAENAAIPPSSLYNAMDRGSPINVSHAIAVARTMGVTVEWLFDDKKGWDDLPERPFWLEPGINPGQAIDARRALESKLGVDGEAVTAARTRRTESRQQRTTARGAAKPTRRRKSAS